MKISIIGYSGSGKSTLARKLGETYGVDVLHLDTVQFKPDWEIREPEEKKKITEDFLNSHDAWVIDGNYSKLWFERRMEESDKIILLLFNRVSCLARVCKRFRKYRNTTRPDIAAGCTEKIDREFILWVLHGGRTKKVRAKYREVISQYPEKIVVIKNQRQLSAFMKTYE